MNGVRVALVGCGNWGRNHARILAELGALAVICDARNQVAGPLAADLGVPLVPDLRAAFEAHDVDAVLIATPAETHFSIAMEAMVAGKDVFVEKPITLDIDDAEALVAEAEARDRVLMVGHLLHYHPVFRAAQQMIEKGELGELRYVYSSRLNMGTLRATENVLWSFAPHDISMILALLGGSPDTVDATGHAFVQGGIADIVTLHMGFPCGAAAHVFVSWLNPFKEQKLSVVGERGMLVFDDTKPWDEKLVHYRHRVNMTGAMPRVVKAEGEIITVPQGEPLRREVQHFLQCVATRERPRTDGREGLAVLKVLSAAEAELSSTKAIRPLNNLGGIRAKA